VLKVVYNYNSINIKEKITMANFTELNAKEMNETDGGFIPIVIGLIAAGTAAYAAYQASHK